ncbi:MAG: PQQ-binding-like beta-propeller repeat protein [Bacteroidota bacterium]
MNYSLKLILISLISFTFSLPVSAQKQIQFEGQIKDKILNSYSGILLIKTPKSVYGISPQKQDILWENKEFSKLDFSTYSEIPLTPYVISDRKTLVKSKRISNIINIKGISRNIINTLTGDMMFDSEKQGFRSIGNTLLIPEMEAFLVSGIKNKKAVLVLYNYVSDKILWEIDLSGNSLFKKVKSNILSEESTLLDTHKNIFWLINDNLLKINSETGKIEYEKQDVHSILLNKSKDQIFIFSKDIKLEKFDEETLTKAHSTKTMEEVWNNPPTVLGNVSDRIIDNNELIIITSKGFNVINIETGKKKWEKSDPIPLIKKVVSISDGGYLVVQDVHLIYVNDFGKKVWKKSVRILRNNSNQVYFDEENGKVLYITPDYSNIVNIKNGDKYWDNDLVLNKSDYLRSSLKLKESHYRLWYDNKNKQYIIYSDNNLYLINNEVKEKPGSVYEFDFGRKIPFLDIRDNGYFFQSENNFFYFDKSGKLKYRKEYTEKKNIPLKDEAWYWSKRGYYTYKASVGFVKKQIDRTLTNVLVSSGSNFFSNTISSVFGTYQSYEDLIDSYTNIDVDFDSSLLHIFDRIKKGAKQNKYYWIVNDIEGNNSLIRLEIDSGKEKIIKKLDDTQTDFLLDQIESIIYFFGNKTITIEELKEN